MKLSLRKVYRVTYSNSFINNLSPLVFDTIGLINLRSGAIAVIDMNTVADALYFGLRYGRMRVHEVYCDQVVD